MFVTFARRALESDRPAVVRFGRLVIAWLLVNAPFHTRRSLTDRVGGGHFWSKVKATLIGVQPNWAERKIIAAARRMEGDKLARAVALGLFQYGYELLDEGLDWSDWDVLWRH